MIPLWILYATSISGLLGLAALAGERALRLHRLPIRFAWGAAMLGSLALPLALWWSGPVAATPAPYLEAGNQQSVGPEGVAAAPAGITVVQELRRRIAAGVTRAAGAARAELAPWDPLARRLWIASSALLAVLAVLGFLRLWRARRRWPRTTVDGTEVLVSRETGPAVMGLLRPAIVLPRWALSLEHGTRRLILLHEKEHVAARDTQLLGLAVTVLLLAPWNPVLWWQFRRLRAAVEVDCDERVLRSGVPPRDYGGVLLEIGQRLRPHLLAGVALGERSTTLERRLRAMMPNEPRRRGLRTLLASSAALLLIVLACEAPPPTVTEADQEPPDAAATPTTLPAHDGERQVPIRWPAHADVTGAGDPLVYVDGIRMLETAILRELNPDAIERIEVVKGAAARRIYGEDARAGVIQIFTKSGPH